MVTQPCKDCPDRCASPNCHEVCSWYKKFRQENKEQKDAIRAIRAEKIQILNFDPKFEQTVRCKRNRKR